MPSMKTYNDNVAARVRAAQQILNTPELASAFERLGGLRTDLERVVELGLAAEALNHAQADAKSGGKEATVDVLVAFEALQKEYSLVMGVCQAVLGDLRAEGASKAMVDRLADIIRNEAQVAVRLEEAVDGTRTRSTRRKVSQEALRAEMEKDAVALLGFTDVHAPLVARRCTTGRLEKLRDDAQAFAGKLGARTAAKGKAKSATKSEHDVVGAMRLKWGSVYRLLAALGAQDERVRLLLREAGR